MNGLERTHEQPAPRKPQRRSVLACLLRDPRLSAADKRYIREAHQDGLSVADLAALTTYELRLAQRLFETQDITAKDLLIALHKAASHVAASAQLASSAPAGGASITVTFAPTGPTSPRPEAKPALPDATIGDVIDAE